MPIKTITTGQVYNAYDQLIENVERWIQSKNPTVWRCDNGQVKARLTQRIVELSCGAYTEFASTSVDQSESALVPCSLALNFGGLKIQSDTGAVALDPALWIRHVAVFFATWGRLLLLLIVGFSRPSPSRSIPATLLMEAGGDYQGSDANLVRFCRQGPIVPLREAGRIIIQSSVAPKRSTDPSFDYAKYALIHLINNYLHWSHKAALLLQHLLAPIIFLRALFVCPASVLISRDFVDLPIVRWLDKNALIEAMIITTSSFATQPLWMRRGCDQVFELHMIWYSQNFVPKVYVGEEKHSNLPHARHMNVDVHWVWTDGFKAYLNTLHQTSDIRVVGPILWYLPESIENFGDSKLKIAIFDITPLPDQAGAHRTFGQRTNYYSVTLMEKFVKDIVETCRDLESTFGNEITIFLKHKRKPKIEQHDAGYINFINLMLSNNVNFVLLENQVNLFGLLDSCVCSISVPYTSTAYVSASLGKPSIYYDPFGQLIPKYEKSEFVEFAASREELRALIENACKVSLSSESSF